VKPSEVLPLHRETIRQLVLEAGMVNPRVFGSMVRGEDNEESDLDILVDPGSKTSLMDIAGLQIQLEEILGFRVDLLTPGGLHPRFRGEAMAEAVNI
jgi:uncharacterized protein